MFTPSDMERMPKELELLYADLELRIMQDIVRRIKINGEITRGADWQIYRLHELGESKKTIRKMLQETLNLSDKEINKIYREAIASGYARDEQLYKASGTPFIPFKENLVLQQTIKAVEEQTAKELKNITQSLGFAQNVNGKIQFTELSDFYQKTLDDAMLDIISGAFDYNTVLKRTVVTMTKSGLRTVDYATGWSNRVEVASRRAVMTGVTQITGKINEQNAQKLDTEHFEVSWHGDARPSHQQWQGKVYTKKELETICGLGTVEGLGGANCRHTYYPFIPGISERTYTDEQLEEMNAKENEPKEHNGKCYTSYEASQKQRRMETLMRKQRQDIKLLQEGGADENDIINARCRYRKTMSDYVEFSEAMGIPQQRARIYVDGLGNVGVGKIKELKEDTMMAGRDRLGILTNNNKSNPKYYEFKGKNISTVEQEISNLDYEVGVIFDENGKAISAQLGADDEVRFTKYQLKLMKGHDVTHNHPLNTPPSPEDLYLLKDYRAKSFRTCGKKDTYVLEYSKEVEKLPDFAEYDKQYSAVLAELLPDYADDSGYIRDEENLIKLGNAIWERLYNEYGVKPSFERR